MWKRTAPKFHGLRTMQSRWRTTLMAMSVVPCLLVELGVAFMGAGLRPTHAEAQQSFSRRALCHQGLRTDAFLTYAAHRAKSPLAQKVIPGISSAEIRQQNHIKSLSEGEAFVSHQMQPDGLRCRRIKKIPLDGI